jgi:aspartyl-tRNA(Asn)/glutamyl-tRNA(Gln) amidotransferase subunit C
MSLDQATVAKIARLARIKLPEADRAKMAKELSGILDWVEMLKELDTSKVEAMTSTVEMVLPKREDKVTDGGYASAILANATEPVKISQTEDQGGFFTVPKVVE